MFRSYNHLSDSERSAILKLQVRVITFYVAALLVILAVVVVNHSVGNWATSAAQAESTSSASTPASISKTHTRH